MLRLSPLAAVIFGGCLLAACGKSSDTAQAPAATPASSQPQPTPATAAIAAAKALNVADLFPPGYLFQHTGFTYAFWRLRFGRLHHRIALYLIDRERGAFSEHSRFKPFRWLFYRRISLWSLADNGVSLLGRGHFC